MSGTAVRYAGTSFSYAVFRISVHYAAIRPAYAVPGNDVGYGATRLPYGQRPQRADPPSQAGLYCLLPMLYLYC